VEDTTITNLHTIGIIELQNPDLKKIDYWDEYASGPTIDYNFGKVYLFDRSI